MLKISNNKNNTNKVDERLIPEIYIFDNPNILCWDIKYIKYKYK